MRVRDVMKRHPRVVRQAQVLASAAKTLAEADCGALPVLDRHERVVGMITERDISLALATGVQGLSEISVEEVMSRDVHSCRPDDAIVQALATMRTHRVRRLPVLDAVGGIDGLLSLDDVGLEVGEPADDELLAQQGSQPAPQAMHRDLDGGLRDT